MRAPSFVFACKLLLVLSACAGRVFAEPSPVGGGHSTMMKEVKADADFIVVGTGPGGTGFVRRFAELRPGATILWFEKGLDDFVARNWPEDLLDNTDVITPIPRKKLWWYTAYAWNSFGGGDVGNSGGPNYLGLDRSGKEEEAYDGPDKVDDLRENSITPHTTTSRRWEQAFLDSGYSLQSPLRDRAAGENQVGQVSTIRTEGGADRRRFSNEIRNEPNNVMYVHARISKVLHDGARATGVTGIRLATDQSEVGEMTTWTARKAVILAGGVFNTFDLLVESGIGPEEFLKARGVPQPWWAPNERVGKGVGEEPIAVFATIEPETPDQLASEPRLAAQNSDDVSFTYWNSGVKEWLQLSGFLANYVLGSFVPNALQAFAPAIDAFFDQASLLTLGLPTEPVMSLRAVKKWANGTRGFDRNPLGVVLDDTNLEMTNEMCQALEKSFTPVRQYVNLQKRDRSRFSLMRSLMNLLVGIGVFDLIRPNVVFEQNIDTFTENGKDCSMDMLASIMHFYGGCSDVINESYLVDGTTNLYISDASVFRHLAPGATSSMVMQEGMRVATTVAAVFPSEPVDSTSDSESTNA